MFMRYVPLLACALVILSGATGDCNQAPCTPLHPDYDPLTGTCPSQPADEPGPPGPGTGGLPTEPGTETPDDAGDSVGDDEVNLDIYGLNGKWQDDSNGRETCVIHTGSNVSCYYTSEHQCDHADGTGNISYTYIDFIGDLANSIIVGSASACRFGYDDGENGFVDAPMTLTVSADGKSMSGSWYNASEDQDIPISFTRLTVGNCPIPP